jgi:hypothetical protein
VECRIFVPQARARFISFQKTLPPRVTLLGGFVFNFTVSPGFRFYIVSEYLHPVSVRENDVIKAKSETHTRLNVFNRRSFPGILV